jgi:hypothetical protein
MGREEKPGISIVESEPPLELIVMPVRRNLKAFKKDLKALERCLL